MCCLAEGHQPNTTSLEPFWILLEFFGDPNIKDKTGNTPLHYAVKNKNKALILCLMLFGASNDITNEDGKKPFEILNLGEDVAYLNEKVNTYKFYFLQLTRKRRNRLRKIFQFIDTDQGGSVGEINMMTFNMWLNEEPEPEARDDARKFIEEASVFKSNAVRILLIKIFFEEFIVGISKILANYNIEVIDDFMYRFFEIEKIKKKNLYD